ncbi:hypothetical protein OSTOST_25454, partial [Ostertagia ostertagi]
MQDHHCNTKPDTTLEQARTHQLESIFEGVTVCYSHPIRMKEYLEQVHHDHDMRCTDSPPVRTTYRLPLSYAIVRHMAVRINREQGLIENFRASKSWIAKFVRECGLRSRRVTRFVTTKSLRSRQEVEQEANDFVRRVREEMKKYPLSVFANADQTGINKEVASG